MLNKGFVKQTVLTALGRFDLERAEAAQKNCAVTVLKYCVEHAKHASKVILNTDQGTINIVYWRTTFYCAVCWTILMVKSAKGKTNESFDSESAWGFSARCVSVEGLTLVCLVLKGGNVDANQHETNENKNNFRGPQFMYNCDGPNLEWSVLLTRPWAAGSTLVYLEMRDAPRCTAVHHFFRQLAISNCWRRSRRLLGTLRHTDPQLEVALCQTTCFNKQYLQNRVLLGRRKKEN